MVGIISCRQPPSPLFWLWLVLGCCDCTRQSTSPQYLVRRYTVTDETDRGECHQKTWVVWHCLVGGAVVGVEWVEEGGAHRCGAPMLRDRESERCFPNFLCCALLIRKSVIHWQMELVRGPWEGVPWGGGGRCPESWGSFVIRICSRNGFVYSAVRGRLMHGGLCVCNWWSFEVLSRQTSSR